MNEDLRQRLNEGDDDPVMAENHAHPIMSELLQLRAENHALRTENARLTQELADCRAGTPRWSDGRERLTAWGAGSDGDTGGEPYAGELPGP